MAKVRRMRRHFHDARDAHLYARCWGKKPHRTRKAALTAAGRSALTFGHPFEAYKCPECRQWHCATAREAVAS